MGSVPRLTKIYTRTGDDGTTGLGTGARVPKTSLRIGAYGTVDELNAALALALTHDPHPRIGEVLRQVQNDLFHLGADLCIPDADKPQMPGPKVEERHVAGLEAVIDEVNDQLPTLENFILPGGSTAAAHLHLARTICRRAERDVLALAEQEPVSPLVIQYLNRLSDALFVLGRFHNHANGIADPLWNSRA